MTEESSAPIAWDRRSLARWLLTRTRTVLPPLGASILFRIVGLVSGAAIIGLGTYAAASALGGTLSLGHVATLLVVLSLIKAFARYLEQFFGHYVAFKALATLRTYFFRRLEPQAPTATEGRRTGDLLSRATRDIDRIEVFFAHTLGPATTAVIVPLGMGVWLAAAVSVGVASAAVSCWLIVGLIFPLIESKRALGAARRLRHERGELAQHVTDSVQGACEIVAFGYEHRRRAEQDAWGERLRADQTTLGSIVALRRGLIAADCAATVSAIILVGAREVAAGAYGWYDLALAVGVVLGTLPAVTAVEEFSADLDQAFASAARVAQITEARPATPAPVRPVPLPDAARWGEDECPAVRIEDVTFSYAGGLEPAVRGITLDLPAGSTTAIVGASGSGKSTLAHLLARFYDPDEGRISIGGVDVRELADEDLRAAVGIVGQRPYLFNASIAENLRVATPEASDEHLLLACQRAALDPADFADGLDTQVGELGTAVSGGQRQRIAIARALLRDAPILILDEVTSQLDRETEAELSAALAELQRGRTTLIIAHRLETVQGADNVVVLDAGHVVAQGSLLDLAGNEQFRALANRD
ncbi:ABC transporter ATP-binding protein [Rarobacter faecitabidus]|uniref:Thiol reductant ABC exporter CydC subunit n=1 Tax=Rarobacter faecitabidus TaxID=13243 RepID=A0A542ZB04_RARFA|nr:thiol reductant ABC exporter subunit CydC [Rarobacter faecitabidus]TQL57518.1 thiol reductant ABC exporter CydC subunit [Rarobacter faecitabidus]